MHQELPLQNHEGADRFVKHAPCINIVTKLVTMIGDEPNPHGGSCVDVEECAAEEGIPRIEIQLCPVEGRDWRYDSTSNRKRYIIIQT